MGERGSYSLGLRSKRWSWCCGDLTCLGGILRKQEEITKHRESIWLELCHLEGQKQRIWAHQLWKPYSNQAADWTVIAFPSPLQTMLHLMAYLNRVLCMKKSIPSQSVQTSTIMLSIYSKEMKVLAFLPLDTLWKKLILLFPYLSHWILDFCCHWFPL